MAVAKKYQDRLGNIKKNINSAYMAFKENIDRFHYWQRFTFQTTIDATEQSTLQGLERPVVEFNIVNAPVSRLCGEFSKQEPQLYVSPADGVTADPQTLKVVEGYLKHIMYEASKENAQYMVYRDQLSGGFSHWKVYTDYINDRSFDQNIFLTRPNTPTLVFYDPSARRATKSDASYWTEVYPKDVNEFQEEYPDIDVEAIKYTGMSDIDGASFEWAYKSNDGKQKFIVMADYYEKKYRKAKLLKLANGQAMTEQKYEELLENHEMMGYLQQPPAIVDSRTTTICYICRYICIQDKVLSYEETDFSDPNYVFVDGDSASVKEDSRGSLKQFTKPYCLHARGIQKLTNLSGQAIANDMESMTMHKFIIAQEALPDQEEYIEAYRNVQKPATLVYKKYSDNDPGKPNDPPQAVPRVPLPSEVVNTFNNCMQMLQNILGSYDASLGIQNNQLSGLAIVEGATQSNAAAMPYVVNYMQGLNQAAQVIVNIMPKYLVTPRSIPIIDEDGKRAFVEINSPGKPQISYEPGDLHVKVEAGVSFAIAKDRAIKQITALMNVSPMFAQFINEEGLDVLLDNLEFHGVEIVKEKADDFMKKQQQQQQQPSPEQIQAQAQMMTAQARQMEAKTNAMKAETEAKQGKYELMIKAKNAQSTEKEADTDRLNALVAIGESHEEMAMENAKLSAEEQRTRAETAMEISHHQLEKTKFEHEQIKDIIEMANTKKQQEQEAKEAKNDSN